MGDSSPTTSRRSFLGVIAAAPIATLASNAPARNAVAPITASPRTDLEMPPQLGRSREGRSASRFRYHNAEAFFRSIENGTVRDARDRLYQTGIVLQLGLSSHLFDAGFTDEWCARHLGLHITRALACANATGFGFGAPAFDLLAKFLSPYSRWRLADPLERADDAPVTPDQMRMLTRHLLDHVHRVTGHPRPRGWSARHG